MNTPMTHVDDSGIGISDRALRTVAGYATVAGLSPLIPIPFLDDLIIRRTRGRMLQRIADQHDVYLPKKSAKFLTDRESRFLSGALKSIVLWPVKKIIRKLVYVLAIKSCADVATEVFHEGWFFARALEQGYVSADQVAGGDPEPRRQLRHAIRRATEAIDPDVTRQAMRTAFGVGREVLMPLLDSLRGVLSRETETEERRLDAASRDAAPIAARIEEELRAHWAQGPELDRALRDALDG